ncbi:hypothetical protein [Selenomonas artemidis]|uniref:hypothetical protein n=1 Tax=Selenomonas artemidis TaxID=671224 RepID=UPI00288AC8DA|nr:hypothetical protein [Selenomonas artemidis]
MNPYDETLRQLDFHSVPNSGDMAALRRIRTHAIKGMNENPANTFNDYLLMVSIYSYIYGVMQGKRAERARRKGKAAIGAGTPIAATDTKISCPCVMCEYTTQTHQKERGIECSTI